MTELEMKLRQLEERLSCLEAERISVMKEINSLRQQHESELESIRPLLGRQSQDSNPTSNSEKVQLFLKLFRARSDLFPRRWENLKNGKQGYSPACANEWNRPICNKPKVKCSDCPNQAFLPLDESPVEAHLRGTATIGTYAIKEDDTCVFLACDFDENSWRSDVAVYRDTARSLGIDAAVEISRSGNGAHAWIFFEEPIACRLARSLGTLILAQCSERNLRLSLDSYDRFFPSQDYLPRGGFGNLIALPLQKVPRDSGNTCFVDENFKSFRDQWSFLSSVRRLSASEVRHLLAQYLPPVTIAHSKAGDSFEDIAWATDNAILEKTCASKQHDQSLLNETVEITFGPMLVLSTEKMPARVVAKLKKTASFANPEFYKLQRMRMQTYPHRRFIFTCEIRPSEILLPRGALDEVTRILTLAGAQVIIRDERIAKRRIKVEFLGTLTGSQKEAVKILRKSDTGVLVAPPGSGKTVMGCALIAERRVSTLILVHRQPLLEQWKERISTFLGVPSKEIGNLSGSKKKMTGKIDLAMLQSLNKLEDLSEIAQAYSQIIIDECHHIPAASFEAILKQLPARYVTGLTATPYRKDGLEKILFQQCGPVRHSIDGAESAFLSKSVQVHETGFRIPDEYGNKPAYHVLLQLLISDHDRNLKIVKLTVEALANGRFPLLISDRKDHLDMLGQLIADDNALPSIEMVRLDGDLTQSSDERL